MQAQIIAHRSVVLGVAVSVLAAIAAGAVMLCCVGPVHASPRLPHIQAAWRAGHATCPMPTSWSCLRTERAHRTWSRRSMRSPTSSPLLNGSR
jgi:hypothetical protein